MSDVLVYSGPGVSASALHHTLKTLRLLLSSYDVKTVNAKSLALDPWQKGTSMVVIPGGRDLPFVSELSKTHHHTEAGSSKGHQASEKVRDFVERGGSYFGICAGAYFASSHCTFEQGTAMEVDGPRPFLRFFPGTCQGTVYPGFVYESDKGARIIDIERTASAGRWRCHYNGGGAFMSAQKYANQGVEVLATYCDAQPEELMLGLTLSETQPRRPDYAGEAAAIVVTVGKGKALLFGTHPEFPLLPTSTPVLNAENDLQGRDDQATLAADLLEHEKRRLKWLSHLFQHRLQLRTELPSWAVDATPSSGQSEPRLLPILAAGQEDLAPIFQQALADGKPAPHLVSVEDSTALQEAAIGSVSDSNDPLHFVTATPDAIKQAFRVCQDADYALYSKAIGPTDDSIDEMAVEVDLDSVPKYIMISSPDSAHLDPFLFPYWNTSDYFSHLTRYRALNAEREVEQGHWSQWKAPFDPFNPFASNNASAQTPQFGSPMLYTQMVTSTQTMLDKNYRLLSALPVGTTFFATQQMSGRGRGANRWISPKGCLQFSSVFRVPVRMAAKTVFLQYLSGLAVVEGIRLALGPAGHEVAEKVRMKWPNDIYAEIPAHEEQERAKTATFELNGKRYAKLGGILVNSQFSGGQEFILISGCGVNCLNARPTTSVSDLVQIHNQQTGASLPQVTQEQLAGAILSTFDSIWKVFMQHDGNFGPFVERYRQIWLHGNQETTLTSDALRAGQHSGEEQVRIVGISSDHGLLQAVPLTSTVRTDDPSAWGDTKNSEAHGIIQLQPDGNSFDMLQNLLKRKV